VRTTPEGWQDVLKQMILRNGLSVTPAEARSIVKYLSDRQGLAPEESKPVMYDVERRVVVGNSPDDLPLAGCAKCHATARALSWRRSPEEWKRFAGEHAARAKFRVDEQTVALLARTAPLHTPEWDAWSVRSGTADLSGRWLIAASRPGHGKYYGEMQVERQGGDEYTTRVNLTSMSDGTRLTRAGRIAVFGNSAWRGRSSGGDTSRGDKSGDAREVLWIAPDHASAKGRWFWGQYQEFGYDVELLRPSAGPTLLSIDRSALKTGTQANRIRLIGDRLPAKPILADLDFGPGTMVRSIVFGDPGEVVVEVDVTAEAVPGRRNVGFRHSVLQGAMAIYDRVDYIKVTPDSAMAAFADTTHPLGYQQFEAIGYQRGPDGRSHTDDDLELGPVDVTWSAEVFHAPEGSSPDYVGTVSPAGIFAPAAANPGNNFDVWVTATAKDEKDGNGKPLVGKSYLVVTVPTYTLNGRKYVRELDRWVDDGPATAGRRE
jgi:quinohemoprotein amine dehydrogenase